MATYTVANGGGNINSASTYVGGVGIPGAADTINFTTTSGQLTVNVTTTILDIDFSNYKNQIVFSNILNVSRNITFGDAGGNATYTVLTNAGGKFIKTGTGQITSNGKTWTGNFELGGTGTYTLTLNDVINISGELLYTNNSTVTINSANVLDPERFNLLGNFTFSLAGTLAGTATIRLTGGSNQTWSAGSITNNVKIDKSGGTLSITGTLLYNTGTLTYVAGTVNTAGSTLRILTATFDTKGSSTAGATTTSSTGINWDTVTCANTNTMTISSNFTAVGTFTVNNAVALTVSRSASSGDLYLNSNFAMGLSTSASITSSAATIIMNGTGNWSGGGIVAAPLTFNTSGTITITGVSGTGVVQFNTRTLTYLSGTIVTTGSTLTLVGSCTLATSGITWNNLTILGTNPTLTLSSNLNINGTLTLALTSGTLNFSTGGNLLNTTGDLSVVSGTTNLPNDIYVTNATLGVTTANPVVNSNTIYISGNLTTINTGNSSGTTNLVLNGTGTWSNSSTGIIQLNLEINTSGTITIGSVVYYSTKILTYTSGSVDVTTNNSTLVFSNTSTFNNNNLVLNNLQLNTNSAILTLSTDLYCLGEITLGQGGKSIAGTYSNIYCDVLRFANNINAGYIYNLNGANIYTNDLLLQGAISGSAFNLNGNAMIYVNRDLYVTGGVGHAGHYYGNSKIFLTGTGTLSTASGLTLQTTINTSGKITISSTLYLGAQGPSGASGTTFTYIKGTVIANNSTLSLQIASSSVYNLISMNKIAWGNVVVTSGITLNMNEFFCGNAYTRTNVRATTTATNYTVTFTDNFEKISKFVNITNCTLSRPQQLLVITDSKKSSTNTRGIRYINNLPNGVAKNDPSTTNPLGYSVPNYLVGDPTMTKY